MKTNKIVNLSQIKLQTKCSKTLYNHRLSSQRIQPLSKSSKKQAYQKLLLKVVSSLFWSQLRLRKNLGSSKPCLGQANPLSRVKTRHHRVPLPSWMISCRKIMLTKRNKSWRRKDRRLISVANVTGSLNSRSSSKRQLRKLLWQVKSDREIWSSLNSKSLNNRVLKKESKGRKLVPQPLKMK